MPGVLRAAAGPRVHDDRRLRRRRRVPVLRVLRGHARADVLPHRLATAAHAAAVRGGEVLPLLAGRRPVHARRGDRPVGARRAHLRLADADRRWTSPPAPSAGCSSASSSPSRSRRRSSRSTPGCPTPVARPRPAPRRCWSACWTRSARSASCATACRCSRTRRSYFAPLAHRAGAGRHHLRRAAGGRPERPEAAGRRTPRSPTSASSASASSPSPPRPAPARCSTWSTTASPPACSSWSSACWWPAAARRWSATSAAPASWCRCWPGCFFFAGLASLALPGTAPFVSEFLVLIGTFTVNKTVAVDRHRSASSWPPAYVLWMVQRTTQGTPNPALAEVRGDAQGPLAARGGRGRAADRAAAAARLLPEAGARRDQPGGRRRRMHGHRQDRPGADGRRRRQASERRSAGDRRSSCRTSTTRRWRRC